MVICVKTEIIYLDGRSDRASLQTTYYSLRSCQQSTVNGQRTDARIERPYKLFPIPYSLFPVPYSLSNVVWHFGWDDE